MTITKGQAITLANGDKYLIICGKKIGERDFCIAATAKGKMRLKLLQLSAADGKAEACLYDGPDFADIFLAVCKDSNQRNTNATPAGTSASQ